ncbi:MAG TPA: hypothetical protein VKS44_10060 [Candidatus Acidoferrales bacterium]|nr:hypothetical protein [Candidatus Acidoferrales bacterium]
MDEPKTEGHKENPESDSQASNDGSPAERVVQNVNSAPRAEAPSDPRKETPNQKGDSFWPKIAEAIRFWLHRYWETPREKAKWTDGATVVLTLLIAIAAFWSACIFQGQLTVARQTMEAQTRPWVGSGEVKVKNPMFVVYPSNPIQGRTQISFAIDIPIKNFGNSPAFHVDTEVGGTMTEQVGSSPNIDAEMEYTCGRADGNAKSVGGVLFPNSSGTTLEVPENIGVPLIKITEVHRVWIVVCIAYSETTSGQQLHHTKLWLASWPITKQPTEIRRSTQPKIIYYSPPITGWVVAKTEAD